MQEKNNIYTWQSSCFSKLSTSSLI
jgi:hypothetical protein